MDWMVRGLNLVGARFSIQAGSKAHPASSAVGTGSFTVIKQPGCEAGGALC